MQPTTAVLQCHCTRYHRETSEWLPRIIIIVLVSVRTSCVTIESTPHKTMYTVHRRTQSICVWTGFVGLRNGLHNYEKSSEMSVCLRRSNVVLAPFASQAVYWSHIHVIMVLSPLQRQADSDDATITDITCTQCNFCPVSTSTTERRTRYYHHQYHTYTMLSWFRLHFSWTPGRHRRCHHRESHTYSVILVPSPPQHQRNTDDENRHQHHIHTKLS